MCLNSLREIALTVREENVSQSGSIHKTDSRKPTKQLKGKLKCGQKHRLSNFLSFFSLVQLNTTTTELFLVLWIGHHFDF